MPCISLLINDFNTEIVSKEQFCLYEEMITKLVKNGVKIYKSDLENYAPYGIAYLEQSNTYKLCDDNTKAIEKICDDIKEKREHVLRELEGYDACLMIGPTCLMHYTGMTSISVPFAVNKKDGLLRSMILYTNDERRLISFAR